MHENITTYAKYKDAFFDSVYKYWTYLTLVWFQMRKHSVVGKRLLGTGLLLAVSAAFTIKSPAFNNNLAENAGVIFINNYQKHWIAVLLFGDDLERWNYWQMT